MKTGHHQVAAKVRICMPESSHTVLFSFANTKLSSRSGYSAFRPGLREHAFCGRSACRSGSQRDQAVLPPAQLGGGRPLDALAEGTER